MREKNIQMVSDLLLLSVAVIWGLGFPVTVMAIEANISSGLMVALRFGIAAAVVGAVSFRQLRSLTWRDVRLGGMAGLILGTAFLLQIMGQGLTTPSNSAFLTSLNVIIVPFLSWAFFRQRPSNRMLLVAFGCLVGAAVLTISPEAGLQFNAGDLITLACAFVFSLHISYLGRIAGRIEAGKLTFLQMVAAALLGLVYTLAFEWGQVAQANLSKGLVPVLYLGLLSSAFSFFAQTFAQKHTSPARAAVILGCEGLLGSVFSVLLGYEPLTANLILGGLIIFTSLLVMEVNPAAVFRRRFGRA